MIEPVSAVSVMTGLRMVWTGLLRSRQTDAACTQFGRAVGQAPIVTAIVHGSDDTAGFCGLVYPRLRIV